MQGGDGERRGPRCAKGCHKYLSDSLYKVHDPKHPEQGKHKCPTNEDGSAMICKNFDDCQYLRGHPEEVLRRQQERTDRLITQEKGKQKALDSKLKAKVDTHHTHTHTTRFCVAYLQSGWCRAKRISKHPQQNSSRTLGMNVNVSCIALLNMFAAEPHELCVLMA